ncbi:hypothetical protein G7046_g871 [Stylonectria norvegica]|nr:hypothetical protein G7046_g871 [Stylonectria norvegica]
MKFINTLPVVALALQAHADDIWTNPDGGNTHVDIGDGKVEYGYAPPWYAFEQIKSSCPSNGCNSENKIEYATGIVKAGALVSATIILSVEGSFNDAGEQGSRDQLVDIVNAVAGSSPYEYDKDVKYTTGNGCVVAGSTPCNPGNSETVDQYTATNLIVVRVENQDGSELADMSVSITVDISDADDGLCSDLTTAGAAVAGAVSGIAGGIFSLAGLACA